MAIDASLLTSYYQTRYGAPATLAASTTTLRKTPTAPWEQRSTAPKAPELVKAVLAGKKFIDPDAAKLDVKGASEDYKKMFGLFQGLNALNALAERADTKGVTKLELDSLSRRFKAGMAEVDAFTSTLKLDQLRLIRGDVMTTAKTQVGVKRDVASYVTGMIHQGTMDQESPALTGDVKFTIAAKRSDGTLANIAVDLADMGTQTRSFGNLINFLNSKMEAADLITRFDREKLLAETRTIDAGGKKIELPVAVDRWAMKIKGVMTETLTFGAPATADAVYLAGTAGKDDTKTGSVSVRTLAKFQSDLVTEGAAGPTTAPDAYQPLGDANWAEGRAFARTLGPEVAAVRATAAGADGSVYVLADVTAKVDGQTLQGDRDVALLKYDSAGALVFSRTLGAADEAQGYALAVSGDGKVAVAGSVKGALGGTDTSIDAKSTDSFVTLFDDEGQELWTRRRGASGDDEAQSVAFAADGTVYVGGRTKTGLAAGATAQGGWDGYVQSFAGADGKLVSAVQFGTSENDGVTGLAVQGSQVVVAGAESGHAVLRSFSAGVGGALTAGAVRDLGDLGGGGTVAGLAFNGTELVIAGSSANAGLSAGTVTAAHSGGIDGFVARLSASLAAAGGDSLTFFGGAGEDRVTALTVRNGQAYIAGSSTGALPDGSAALGAKDGFLARIDPVTGAVGWSQRYTGKDGDVAPTSIAVAAGGASVLDRLGLPKGVIDYTNSKQVVAATSARAGDTFYVGTREGQRGKAVTIAADDTLKTLSAKISRALGFNASATIVKDGAYDRIQIKPRNERIMVEITPGAGGKNALESLGLTEGVVKYSAVSTSKSKAVEDDRKSYGLKLDRDLNLADSEERRHALAELQTAMVSIRTAFRELRAKVDPTPPAPAQVTGKASAYMSNQISNYQAALDRLTGGG